MYKKTVLPEHACNSHLHIIDPAFENDGKALSQKGTVKEYTELSRQLGLPRAVFVQAKPFGTDNSCLLDAIQKFGPENSRGIAVVTGDITDRELDALHSGGVRGLRFSVWNPANAVVSFDMCRPLSERTRDMGWNMQLHMSSAQLLEYAPIIESLDCRIVIDHMGRLKPELGTGDPAFPFICRLIDKGNTWVKLSGPYLSTRTGEPWDDAAAVAEAFVNYAPERMLWGNDFPHVTEKTKPDEWALLETIDRWFPDEHSRFLALEKNPEDVYGFSREA